ncbi:hypothetical protein [Shewanella youngdeokensis]|uniref:DUF4402 domain-containing protein n=1 Tax=Shewanella youngdeokensis TaxID=2999068 RepID=A0ABZ0K282_9GAMM|nr:hypothetical protein RGE70_07870 [Shewanella sp. DAU334]
MKNKILVSSLLASSLLLTAQAHAVDATGTAYFNLVAPITVAKNADLNLGDIDIATDGNCQIDAAGNETGTNCLATGTTRAVGTFDITGLDAGAPTISVSGADTSVAGVTFTPLLPATALTIDGSGNATVSIGGNVAVVAASTVAGAKQIDYTVSVTY